MKADPKPWHEPEVSISPTQNGYEIVVGYHIDKYWYTCRKVWAGTKWGARRKARKLVKWYRNYVKRYIESEKLEGQVADG